MNALFGCTGCTGVSPMLELMKYINLRKKPRARRAGISLSGMLEAFIRNYYVDGESEAVPFHVAACVSSVYRRGFVLIRCIRKFSRNMSGYGITCVPAPEFASELLPEAFSDIL